MKLSREQFIRVIDSIKAQRDRDREISRSIGDAISDGGNIDIVFSTPLCDSVINAIDIDGIISWWVYETEFGELADKYKINNQTLHSPGELYDFLERLAAE